MPINNSIFDQLDKIDYKLLSLLQIDAKLTNAQLAQITGLSPAATLARVRKLEALDIIQGYHAHLDKDKISLTVLAFVYIQLTVLNQHNISAVQQHVLGMPEVLEAYHIACTKGDVLLKIVAMDMSTYTRFITEKLSQLSCIQRISSEMILDTLKHTSVLGIPPIKNH